MRKTTRKHTRTVRELFLWEVRPVLDKLEDLEFGHKVQRLLEAKIDGKPALVECLYHLQRYFESIVDKNAAVNVLNKQAKVLARLESLAKELKERSEKTSKHRVRITFRRKLTDAYLQLVKTIHSERISLQDGTTDWAACMKIASRLWPNEIRL